MPHKRRNVSFPKWIDDIDDDCLRVILEEAVVARRRVIRAGSDNPRCRGAFRSAEATMDQLEYGRIRGAQAHKRATDAVRKYATALECATPSTGK